jgi:hypothetical protein
MGALLTPNHRNHREKQAMPQEPATIVPLSDFTRHISSKRVDIDQKFTRQIRSICQERGTLLWILITREEEALVQSAWKYSDSKTDWNTVQIDDKIKKRYYHWPTADYLSRHIELKQFNQTRREYWHAIEQQASNLDNKITFKESQAQARNLNKKIAFKKLKASFELIEKYLSLEQLKFSSQLPSRPNVGSHYLIHKESTNIKIPKNMPIQIMRIQNSVPNIKHLEALFDQINHMREKKQSKLVVICDQDDMLLNRSEALAKQSCVLNAAVIARLCDIKAYCDKKGIGIRFVSVTSRKRLLGHEMSKNPVSITTIKKQVLESTDGNVELLVDPELSFSNPQRTGNFIPKVTHFLNLTLSADDESDGSESTLSSINDSYRSDNEDIESEDTESEDTESEDTENDNTRYHRHRMAEEKNSHTPCENLEAITINDKEDIRRPSPAGTDSDETAPPKTKRLNSSSSGSLIDSNTDESKAPPLDVRNALVALFDDNREEIDPWLIKKVNDKCKSNHLKSNVQVVAIHSPSGVDERDLAVAYALRDDCQARARARAQRSNTIFTEPTQLNSTSEIGNTGNRVNSAPGV